jgi:hypothetical protein
MLGLTTLAVALWAARPRLSPATLWNSAALVCLFGTVVIRPFFWYPTRWNDQREQAIEALAVVIREREPAVTVQDIAAALEFLGHLRSDATWTWPNEFPQRILAAAGPTLLVVEVDASGKPLTRYPSAVSACLTDAAEVAQFESPKQPNWVAAIDRLSARNHPVHWRAYWVTDRCRSQQR